jgi:hypothetical protein
MDRTVKTVRLLIVADNTDTIESARMAAQCWSPAPSSRKRLMSVHHCGGGVVRMLPMEDARVGRGRTKACSCPSCNFKLVLRGY